MYMLPFVSFYMSSIIRLQLASPTQAKIDPKIVYAPNLAPVPTKHHHHLFPVKRPGQGPEMSNSLLLLSSTTTTPDHLEKIQDQGSRESGAMRDQGTEETMGADRLPPGTGAKPDDEMSRDDDAVKAGNWCGHSP